MINATLTIVNAAGKEYVHELQFTDGNALRQGANDVYLASNAIYHINDSAGKDVFFPKASFVSLWCETLTE